jgi:hypothetical protein
MSVPDVTAESYALWACDPVGFICYIHFMPRLAGEQLQIPEAPADRYGDWKAEPAPGEADAGPRRESHRDPHPSTRRSAAELLTTQGALLTRSHLRELGLERRAVDAVFRALPVVALPGYSRPMIRADEYLALVEKHTYRDDRVRPTRA